MHHCYQLCIRCQNNKGFMLLLFFQWWVSGAAEMRKLREECDVVFTVSVEFFIVFIVHHLCDFKNTRLGWFKLKLQIILNKNCSWTQTKQKILWTVTGNNIWMHIMSVIHGLLMTTQTFCSEGSLMFSHPRTVWHVKTEPKKACLSANITKKCSSLFWRSRRPRAGLSLPFLLWSSCWLVPKYSPPQQLTLCKQPLELQEKKLFLFFFPMFGSWNSKSGC